MTKSATSYEDYISNDSSNQRRQILYYLDYLHARVAALRECMQQILTQFKILQARSPPPRQFPSALPARSQSSTKNPVNSQGKTSPTDERITEPVPIDLQPNPENPQLRTQGNTLRDRYPRDPKLPPCSTVLAITNPRNSAQCPESKDKQAQ